MTHCARDNSLRFIPRFLPAFLDIYVELFVSFLNASLADLRKNCQETSVFIVCKVYKQEISHGFSEKKRTKKRDPVFCLLVTFDFKCTEFLELAGLKIQVKWVSVLNELIHLFVSFLLRIGVCHRPIARWSPSRVLRYDSHQETYAATRHHS